MSASSLRPFAGRLRPLVGRLRLPATVRLSHVHRLAGGTWKAYIGQRGAKKGQHGWKNTATGRIVYQAQPPKSRVPAKPVLPAGKGKAAKPAPKAKAKVAPKAKPVRPSVEQMHERIEQVRGQKKVTAKHLKGLAGQLAGLTVKELTDLKKKLGVRASGTKSVLAQKIAERAVQKAEKALEKPAATKPEAKKPQAKKPIPKAKAKPPKAAPEKEHEKEPKPPEGGGEAPGASGEGGPDMAETSGESRSPEHGEERPSADKPPRAEAPGRVPAPVQEVSKRLDRYEKMFRDKGAHQAADWMGLLRNHINQVGVETALQSLGTEKQGQGHKVQYAGADLVGNDAHFITSYLDRAGITLAGDSFAGDLPGISGLVPSEEAGEGFQPGREDTREFLPSMPNILSKLEESKHLPGLESSEDLGKLMGGELGAVVKDFAPDVVKKLDETYGEGKWLVKPYDDEAYAGFGIFFADHVRQKQQDANNAIWASGEHLAHYGFSHLRDAHSNIIGIKDRHGKEYKFGKVGWQPHPESGRPTITIEGTPEYNTIYGDARHWADLAAVASLSEKGTSIPYGKYMAQPAFPVVGVTNEQRAAGFTGATGGSGESRTHIVTRNGKAEWVAHSTWIKGETLPVVFENDDTRAMAQSALEAINRLPESERQGQAYAPDLVRTADGYKVVEVNGALPTGSSGYLADNPLIIDAYVSQLTGREPAHVAFIRRLLTKKTKAPPAPPQTPKAAPKPAPPASFQPSAHAAKLVDIVKREGESPLGFLSLRE
jgi:hypothetical protein